MRARGVGIGKAKFEFNVVDENGVPVPGARIGAGGYTYGPQFPDIEVFTNKRGKASFKLRSSIDAGANVTKTGYYTSNFEEVLGSLGKIEHGRWLPWPIKKTLVLKRKRNPIPMYAKHVRTLVPVSGEPVGFDLEKADWVAPHGEGKNSDFVFTITGTYEDWRNRQAAMTLNFSNERDGIQFSEQAVKRGRPAGSEFASAHEAPLQGYKRDYRYERVYAPLGKPDKNIASRLGLLGYYRVRSKTDEHGQVTSALYGKTYGDFYCDYDSWALRKKESPAIVIMFTYYLNPEGTRNVEFDPNQNLFPTDPHRHSTRYGSTVVTCP